MKQIKKEQVNLPDGVPNSKNILDLHHRQLPSIDVLDAIGPQRLYRQFSSSIVKYSSITTSAYTHVHNPAYFTNTTAAHTHGLLENIVFSI